MYDEKKEISAEELEQITGGSAVKTGAGKKIVCPKCSAEIELTIPQILSRKPVQCPACKEMVEQDAGGADSFLKSVDDRRILNA